METPVTDTTKLPDSLDEVRVFMGERSDDNTRWAAPAADYYSAEQMRAIFVRANRAEAELAALKASIEAAPVAITNGYDIWTVDDMPDLPDMRHKPRVRLLPADGEG